MSLMAPQVPCPNCGEMLTVGNICSNCNPFKGFPDPYIRIRDLESSNAALKAANEKYEKALDEIIALNHPHGEDSQHCALCIAR